MIHDESIDFAGRSLTIETGKVAWQANGAVTVRYGDTIVLATAVASKAPRPNIDFFPLTVDFEEKLYAAGKIPGGYIKREGRPSTEAILTSRLTDRPLRPLFPKGFRNDVQIMVTPLSVDHVNDPAILSVIGASAALTISDIPFNGPVGAVRVGYIDDKIVINPQLPDLENSRLDLVMAATRDAIVMVEAGAKEVPEDVVLEALRLGHDAILPVIEMQERLRQAAGKEKREFPLKQVPDDLVAAMNDYIGTRLHDNLVHPDKQAREEAVDALEAEVVAHFEAQETWDAGDIASVFESILKKTVRGMILKENVRPDGRTRTEIRPLSVEVGLVPRVHGSGLFSRGQTQALTIATLGSGSDEQIIDGLGLEEAKRYLHHYNFPPFSVGESRPVRGPGRREIGHGMLAERALEAVIPSQDEFPYTIRLLTEIQGVEDALGDMDFKVTGTREGVTAIQMDIKVSGLTREIMAQALEQARQARLVILDKIHEVMPEPRSELSEFAPRITRIKINPDKIGTVIGPQGKMIKKIIEETKAQVDIEDDGSVFIATNNADSAQKAIDMIKGLTQEVEVGQTYNGTVKRILDFGAFVEVLPGKEGLVHISQLANHRVNRVEDVVNVGDHLEVKVTGIDSMGRINLSHRALLEPSEGEAEPAGAGSRGPRPGGFRDGGRDGGFRRGPRDHGRPEGRRDEGRRDGGFRRDRPDRNDGENR